MTDELTRLRSGIQRLRDAADAAISEPKDTADAALCLVLRGVRQAADELLNGSST